jgi:hypothetical protein
MTEFVYDLAIGCIFAQTRYLLEILSVNDYIVGNIVNDLFMQNIMDTAVNGAVYDFPVEKQSDGIFQIIDFELI